jgi:hypothetical protein
MKRGLLVVFAAAVLLYLPAIRYGFVQDDRAIIERNPAAHAIPAALAAFDDPFWPHPSSGGMYRPMTILAFALDWSVSGGQPGWLHFMSALWHGLAAVLFTLIFARWAPGLGALAAGLVFAVHPVHVEGVTSLVARAELLAAAAVFAAVLCARRGWWAATVAVAAVAMLSKEHGIAAGVLVLVDDLLGRRDGRPGYPVGLYVALAAVSAAYLALWWQIGHAPGVDRAPVFYDATTGERLATALPAVFRAATLFLFPIELSADYGPQVIPVRSGFSPAALAGLVTLGVVIWLAVWGWRRRRPALCFVTIAAALAYLPTSNLLFAAGVVLAERTLYFPVILVSGLAGLGIVWLAARAGAQRAALVLAVVVLLLAYRSWARLPAWESNRTFLLTLLAEHPESYRGHVWAAAVFTGIGDTAGARREYRRAEQLFDRDPHLDASHAYYLMTIGDTVEARPRLERARRAVPGQPFALRAEFLLRLHRRDRSGARAVADTALGWSRWDEAFYRDALDALSRTTP